MHSTSVLSVFLSIVGLFFVQERASVSNNEGRHVVFLLPVGAVWESMGPPYLHFFFFFAAWAAFTFFIWVTPKAAFKRPLYFQLLQICPVLV